MKKLLTSIGFENADGELVFIIQSIVFAADTPVTINKINEILPQYEIEDIEKAISAIFALHSVLGIKLNRVQGGYLFMTKPRNQKWIKKFLGTKKFNLSQASLETLAIVAYLQPATQSEINDIRGVKSESSLKLLIDRDLIKISGRRKEPGRPLIYTTTKDFLKFFNISTLNDLPDLEEQEKNGTLPDVQDSREILLKELLDNAKISSSNEEGIEKAFEKLESKQEELSQLEEKLVESFGIKKENDKKNMEVPIEDKTGPSPKEMTDSSKPDT
ncbi:MAG: SMC-Scp complex subunit ScpB, partial [Deltaproteobacteria bacterium]|nr:SMC-Scp complex subunit ScpB [Deltaproteobacteria bacterium]